MSVTTFLSNSTLWQALAARVKGARHVDAAIAYFGQGGSKLLPLRRGDRLIVDMSPATVRAGGTDPREVEKLMQRGVEVFTRGSLHAKIVVADSSVIAGSANISQRSQAVLDEAGILTSDPAAIRRAREFIERLCTEPVDPEYLERCKELYRPPRFKGQAHGKGRAPRATHAKLWIVNLRQHSVPESEADRYQRGDVKAARLVKDEARWKRDSFHWPFKPKMADELELGDWIIQVMTHKDKSVIVYAPGRFLFVDNYVRDKESGKERWIFHLAVPRRGETLTWKEFRRAAKPWLGASALTAPRTGPIRDIEVADGLLGLWTPGGRRSRR